MSDETPSTSTDPAPPSDEAGTRTTDGHETPATRDDDAQPTEHSPTTAGPSHTDAAPVHTTPADAVPAHTTPATHDDAGPAQHDSERHETEPVTTEPVTAEPVTTEPVTTEPAPAAARPTPSPTPRPSPGPRPGPVPSPAAVAARPAAVRPAAPSRPASTGTDPGSFGRVDDEGTVWVRTTDGERAVGSYPGAGASEALAYFVRKYDEIVAQIDLFEQRLGAADMSPAETEAGVARLREAVREPNAVGDLAALTARVEGLAPAVAERRRQADVARGKAREAAKARRLTLVETAEQLAATPAEKTRWRVDGQTMKELFDTWRSEQKGEGRLDRRSEDELWKRFSHARTAFDRKRRQHFAHLDEVQTEARAAKEKLVTEAEALQDSTDWGPTAQAYKRLMDRWRAAGRANRKDDDALWQRFRTAQDAFFAARHAAQAVQDSEFAANLEVKLALLTRAEALVPVTDLAAAKSALRDIQERWESVGKVPRADLDQVERRLRAVEQAVRETEDKRWRTTNPEARARAQSAVDQLVTAIADLEADLTKARDQGATTRVAEIEASLTARHEWLTQARKALTDFGG